MEEKKEDNEIENRGSLERIERDGKTYVVFDVVQQLKYQKKRDIVVLIMIALCIIALVMAIVVVVKNADIINRDALIIGMDKHGFVGCQCEDEQGQQWYSTEAGFASTPRRPTEVNFTNILNDIIGEDK